MHWQTAEFFTLTDLYTAVCLIMTVLWIAYILLISYAHSFKLALLWPTHHTSKSLHIGQNHIIIMHIAKGTIYIAIPRYFNYMYLQMTILKSEKLVLVQMPRQHQRRLKKWQMWTSLLYCILYYNAAIKLLVLAFGLDLLIATSWRWTNLFFLLLSNSTLNWRRAFVSALKGILPIQGQPNFHF